jgi:hypothetical protein
MTKKEITHEPFSAIKNRVGFGEAGKREEGENRKRMKSSFNIPWKH